MPAYNAECFIGAAIESILNQTHRRLEFVVVVDGATDRTEEIAREWAEKDARMTVIRMRRAGISAAMNLGIRATRYAWIAVMHADDVAAPQRLAVQLRAAETNNEVVAWGSYAHHIDAAGKVLSISETGPTSISSFEARRGRLRPILIVHSSALIKRSALLQIDGYDEAFDTSEDLDLFDRLSDVGPIVALPDPLVMRRIHPECNAMRNYGRMHLLSRFVAERRYCAATNQRRLDLRTYLEYSTRRPVHLRVLNAYTCLFQYCYHVAAIRYGQRLLPSACMYAFASAVLSPRYAFPRIWRQFFAFRLKRLQKARPFPFVEKLPPMGRLRHRGRT